MMTSILKVQLYHQILNIPLKTIDNITINRINLTTIDFITIQITQINNINYNSKIILLI